MRNLRHFFATRRPSMACHQMTFRRYSQKRTLVSSRLVFAGKIYMISIQTEIGHWRE